MLAGAVELGAEDPPEGMVPDAGLAAAPLFAGDGPPHAPSSIARVIQTAKPYIRGLGRAAILQEASAEELIIVTLSSQRQHHATRRQGSCPIFLLQSLIWGRYHGAVELRHLRYFVALAEELHFGRAAARLHIAQPPLSQQIQHLEKDLGAQLLTRTKRHVELTDAGRVLLKEAQTILARADHAVAAVRRADSGLLGHLNVGFVEAIPYTLLPAIVRRLRARAPDVGLKLVESSTSRQLALIRAGELDVGLVSGPIQADAHLEFERIWREPAVLTLPDDHAGAGFESVPLASLADDPFVILPPYRDPRIRNRHFYNLVLSACSEAGFTPRIVYQATPATLLVSLVAAGVGVAILPGSVRHIDIPGVVYRQFSPGAFDLDLYAVWRRDARSHTVETFLSTMLEPP